MDCIHQIRLRLGLKKLSNVKLIDSADFIHTDGVTIVITCRTDSANIKNRQTLMHKRAVFTNLTFILYIETNMTFILYIIFIRS